MTTHDLNNFFTPSETLANRLCAYLMTVHAQNKITELEIELMIGTRSENELAQLGVELKAVKETYATLTKNGEPTVSLATQRTTENIRQALYETLRLLGLSNRFRISQSIPDYKMLITQGLTLHYSLNFSFEDGVEANPIITEVFDEFITWLENQPEQRYTSTWGEISLDSQHRLVLTPA